jgi:transposase
MAERDSDPGVLLGDRGYDSDRLRQDARDRGAQPEIPTKRSRTAQHSVSKRLYALRARIEYFINRLKNCRRVATRTTTRRPASSALPCSAASAYGSGSSTRLSLRWRALATCDHVDAEEPGSVSPQQAALPG